MKNNKSGEQGAAADEIYHFAPSRHDPLMQIGVFIAAACPACGRRVYWCGTCRVRANTPIGRIVRRGEKNFS